MYKEKLPTYLLAVNERPRTVNFEYKDDNIMSFFSMRYEDANEQILSHIKSKVVRQAIVKYYNPKDGMVYYNTVMLRLLEKITGHEFSSLKCQSVAVFKCEYFGARDIIARNYFIKTQGKMKNKLDCEMNTINPLNIKMTDQPKPEKYNFSDDMVAGSKVLLNGIYGVPALRIHFDVFRRENNEFYNVRNGFTNKERNIVFSAGVTAFAFHNLLSPLQYLKADEIDEYFWYADIEHDNITKFYSFNHKKYCLYDNEIVVRCGGVSKSLIKQWIEASQDDFDFFVSTYFTNGVKVPATRSIRNEMNTISIYESSAQLEKGQSYQDYYSEEYERERAKRILEVRDEIMAGNALYDEGKYGSIGINDCLEDNSIDGKNQQVTDLINEYRKYIKKLG